MGSASFGAPKTGAQRALPPRLGRGRTFWNQSGRTAPAEKESGGQLVPAASQQLNSSGTLGQGSPAQEGGTEKGWVYLPLDEAGGGQYIVPVDETMYCCATHACLQSKGNAKNPAASSPSLKARPRCPKQATLTAFLQPDGAKRCLRTGK